MAQRGGAAGRWFGPGNVYLIHDPLVSAYKIGCTNNPDRRLAEVRRNENNQNLQLFDYIQANERNRAETAAQQAVRQSLGLVKDPTRGGATDWFVPGPQSVYVTPQQVFTVATQAVIEHNRQQK